jgi:Na+/proline symporter
MADFKTHLTGAAVVSGIAAAAVMMTGVATHKAVVGYFALGVVGGLLPDIDSDTSIPLRMAFSLLAVISCFLLAFHFDQRYSLAEMVFVWIACFGIIRYGLFGLFTRITVHRGLIHSIPAGVAAGLLTTLLVYHTFAISPLQAWTCGVFMVLGFLVHLLLDELFSVNLRGMQLKRSFGTAFTLGSRNNLLGTIALYGAIIGLFYLCPPPDAFVRVILNNETYRNVLEQLIPSQSWFNGLFAANP